MCKILTRGFILTCSVFIFIFLFLFFSLRLTHAADESSSQNFKNGFEDGYRDSAEGVPSLCAAKTCKAQNSYERGYTLGYKKWIRENGSKGLIDPLIDSPGKTIGSDFNGDGIHDFIVGAHNNDDSASNAGAAYIFFGATNLSGTKNLSTANSDVKILGKAASDYLGRSVGRGRK